MLFYSTHHKSPPADFKTATVLGQAPDKGLYFPERIPLLAPDFLQRLPRLSKTEIGMEVMQPYVGESIPVYQLQQILTDALNFPFPMVQVHDDMYSLELFHGPTLAFKDVGARFMSRCLGYFVRNNNRRVTVLVATSGDTGGAVADGFYGVEGIDVVILYPSGRVSGMQELQLTTHGKNITALEVSGSFDDCQLMVKQAFADPSLDLQLTSANSINIARWLPQQLYYFFALQQWTQQQPPVIAVPSGNFGNICAGLLAFRSGLPVRHFVAACNANDAVPEYLLTGTYQPKKSRSTISNAMDVGDPNNFVRVLSLFDQQLGALRNNMTAYSISDTETREIMATVFKKHGYLLDPHGAVGYAALRKYMAEHPGGGGIFLETAHPVKFNDVVEPVVQQKIALPDTLKKITKLPRQSISIKPGYQELRSFLLDRGNRS